MGNKAGTEISQGGSILLSFMWCAIFQILMASSWYFKITCSNANPIIWCTVYIHSFPGTPNTSYGKLADTEWWLKSRHSCTAGTSLEESGFEIGTITREWPMRIITNRVELSDPNHSEDTAVSCILVLPFGQGRKMKSMLQK